MRRRVFVHRGGKGTFRSGETEYVKTKIQLFRAVLLLAGGVLSSAVIAFGQDAPEPAPLPAQSPTQPAATAPASPSNGSGGPLAAAQAAAVQVSSDQPILSPAVETLLSFKHSDVKFDVARLMDILRDKRHEG